VQEDAPYDPPSLYVCAYHYYAVYVLRVRYYPPLHIGVLATLGVCMGATPYLYLTDITHSSIYKWD